jgi:hypothetical protein
MLLFVAIHILGIEFILVFWALFEFPLCFILSNFKNNLIRFLMFFFFKKKM